MSFITLVGFNTLNNNRLYIESQFKTMFQSKEYKNKNVSEKIKISTNKFDAIIKDRIYERASFIDTYGLAQKAMGVKIISDEVYQVAKLNGGGLIYLEEKYNFKKQNQSIMKVNNSIKEYGGNFLYLSLPIKVYDESLTPFYIKDYGVYNSNQMLKSIKKNNVDYIDFNQEFADKKEDIFYKTDHHWKTEVAFEAYKITAEYLKNNYRIDYDSAWTDENNYNKYEFDNYYFGSLIGRTGKQYSGREAFQYMTPKFETSFEYEKYTNINNLDYTKKGDFENIYINNGKLDGSASSYYVYNGGNYSFVKIKNNNMKNNMKLLLIKDSFAIPFEPFLSLNFEEVTMIDLRYIKNFNLCGYINENKPDVTIMLHSTRTYGDNEQYKF